MAVGGGSGKRWRVEKEGISSRNCLMAHVMGASSRWVSRPHRHFTGRFGNCSIFPPR